MKDIQKVTQWWRRDRMYTLGLLAVWVYGPEIGAAIENATSIQFNLFC